MCYSRFTRTGSIFIFTFGLLLVMVALAYAFMASARIHRDAGETLNLRSLAELAARQGADHAIQVLTTDYLSQPGVPTTINLPYRTAFAPIDTLRVGKHLRSDNIVSTAAHRTNAGNYRPWGDMGSWEDENENDTKLESFLTTVYNRIYQGGGTYSYRIDGFNSGKMLNIGLGRYIEPGWYHTDLVNRPVSFHLEHPVAANASSPDPAVRRGEPWSPDRQEPFYLDQDLIPVDSRDAARFRLRYAVAIEDLSGHLPMSWQGTYTDGVTDARTAAITDTEREATDEVDHAVGQKYGDSLYNMHFGNKSWWGWLVANGLGHTNWTPATDTVQNLSRYVVLRQFIGGVPQRVDQATPFERPDQIFPATGGHIWASHRGPVMSAGGGRAFIGNTGGDAAPALCYTFTPYGRKPVVTATPSEYRDSYTDCPWQINLPTAVPDAVTRMVYAYLPTEFKSFLYDRKRVQSFTGFNAEGAAQWTAGTEVAIDLKASTPSINLFASSGLSAYFSHLPADQPYPGTSPGSAGPNWSENLGEHIDLNTTTFDTVLGIRHASPRPPFWGMHGNQFTYMPDLKSDYVEKSETWIGGEQWTIKMPSANMKGMVRAEGYWYEDSYFMDLATALFHTIAAAQLAWMEDNGGSSDAHPLDGRPQYPTNMSHPDLAGLLADGQPSPARDRDVMDFDADGDGIAESPSAFNSIRKIDAQFVRNMGEYFGPVHDPATPSQGLYVIKLNPTSYSLNLYISRAELVAWTPSHNIQTLLAASPAPLITPGQAAMMEMVLNDMRMSFFGASPQYHDFQGIDFDNDGTVRCSAYAGGSAPVVSNRFGRVIDPGLGDRRFSLSGCFLLQKSRFFRIFVRGEIFDTLRLLPQESATLEMVYAIDPEGRVYDVNNLPIGNRRDPNGDGDPRDADIGDSQVLFQRWHWIRHQLYGSRGSR